MKIILILVIMLNIFKSDVLGVNLGSEYNKISLIKPGKAFIIVEDEMSKRKMCNAISFIKKERIFNEKAKRKGMKQPSNSFFMMDKYIGNLNTDSIKLYKEKYFEDFKMDENLNFIVENFKLPYFDYIKENDKKYNNTINQKFTENNQLILSLKEIIAMNLNYLKDISDKFSEKPIPNSVFTIPSNWGINKRLEFLDILSLTKFEPLGFVHENSASAVYHAMERNDLNKTHNTVFFNLGSHSTKLSHIQFEGLENNKTKAVSENVNVLYDLQENEIGGYDFDICVAKLLKNKYNSNPKYKIKIKDEDLKVMRRIIVESKKMKEILSVNKVYNFSIQDIFDGVDFNGSLKREEFEEGCKHLFDKLENLTKKFIEESKVNITELNDIEAIGGGIRIPLVQSKMKELFGKPLSFHINSDDSIAQGASFIAANFSSTFKVKKINLEDGPNYEVKIKIEEIDDKGEKIENTKEKETIVFPNRSTYGSKKTIKFTPNNDLKVNLYVQEHLEDQLIHISEHLIKGIKNKTIDEKYKNCTDNKISLGVSLDHFGFPKLHKADLKFTEYKIVKVESTKKNETDLITKNKTINYDFDLNLESIVDNLKLNNTENEFSFGLIDYFKKSEEILFKNSNSKNKLESLIYEINDLVADENQNKFIKETESELLKNSSKELDEWLFSEEGFNSNYTIYDDKYYNISKLLEPIDIRKKEYNGRSHLFKISREYLQDIDLKIGDVKKYRSWITEKQLNDTYIKLEEMNKWLNQTEKSLEDTPLNDDPKIYLNHIGEKVKNTNELIFKLRKIQKPVNKTEEIPSNPKDFDLDNDFVNNLKKANMTKEQIEDLLKSMKNSNSTANATSNATENATNEEININEDDNKESNSTEKVDEL